MYLGMYIPYNRQGTCKYQNKFNRPYIACCKVRSPYMSVIRHVLYHILWSVLIEGLSNLIEGLSNLIEGLSNLIEGLSNLIKGLSNLIEGLTNLMEGWLG